MRGFRLKAEATRGKVSERNIPGNRLGAPLPRRPLLLRLRLWQAALRHTSQRLRVDPPLGPAHRPLANQLVRADFVNDDGGRAAEVAHGQMTVLQDADA